MSTPKAPQPAKLVIGCLLQHKPLLPQVVRKLTDRFGPVDAISPWMTFDFTRYYEPEMGWPLVRRVMAFRKLIDQERLSGIKRFTNDVETEFSDESRRRINLDPGYLLPERFVLATGKNYTHRIYIGNHIYADLTLIFTQGGFKTLPWTYPDDAQPEIQDFLVQIRRKYLLDLKGTPDVSHTTE